MLIFEKLHYTKSYSVILFGHNLEQWKEKHKITIVNDDKNIAKMQAGCIFKHYKPVISLFYILKILFQK